MDSILLFRIDTDLSDCNYCSEECMIGEENIVEIDFASLLVIDEVSVSVVDTVEQEAGKIHGYKIEVHSLDTKDIIMFTF